MNVKAVMLGASAVGKTTILNYLRKVKIAQHVPTIGVDFFVFHGTDVGINICIWDTSGHKRFKYVVNTFVKDVDLCIFVYKDQSSFHTMMNLIADVNEKKEGKRFVIISLGEPDLGESLSKQYGFKFYHVHIIDERRCTHIFNDIAAFCKYEHERTNFLLNDRSEAPKEERRSQCWLPFC